MAEKAGCTVRAEERDDGIYLHIARGEAAQEGAAPQPVTAPAGGPLVLVVPSEFMGRGEHAELGHILVRGLFHTLGEVEPLPDTIIFFNSGRGIQYVHHRRDDAESGEGSWSIDDAITLAARVKGAIPLDRCVPGYAATSTRSTSMGNSTSTKRLM